MTGKKQNSRAQARPKTRRKPRPKAQLAPDPRQRFRNAIGKLAHWSAVACVWGFIAAIGLSAWYAYDLPDVDQALSATRQPTVTVLAADGSEVASYGDLYGMPLDVKDLPPALPQAVLATEDRRFYSHFGVDLIGLARAFYTNVRAGRIVQGGSTITQQVAKNLFLTSERTIKRKAQEVLLALWLERKFTKDQIFTVYLNRVYLGAGVYGVDAAARKYFGKPATAVSTYQAALLAGLLKAPSRYSPLNNPDLSAKRTNQVLANMVAAGYLTAQQKVAATAEKTKSAALTGHRRLARHFADWVMEQVPGYVSAGDRDIVVLTTLDRGLQKFAEERTKSLLDAAAKTSRVSQASLLTMAPDGAVRAMVGGHDYAATQFNRATQALRQPGSAFKPFVYLAGLEAGLTPDSLLRDEPLSVGGWTPRNFARRHAGEVSMREALARSINTVAVRISESAGRRQVINVARRMGLSADFKAEPSLALGSGEVSLIELTGAYAAFANGGFGVWPYAIEEIRDASGRILYRRSGAGPGRVIGADHAEAMNGMLYEVVASGTGRAAALPRPVAGKTGTSQNFRDAWFIGYTAELVTGVWMGNDDGAPMNKVTGGGMPAKLWREVMAAALEGRPPSPLPGMQRQNAPGEPEESFWKKLLAGIAGGEG